MSIDEVMDAAHAYSFKYHCYRMLGKKASMEKWEEVRDSVEALRALRAAIEQHVAEAVSEDRAWCALIADEWATFEQRQFGKGGPAAAIRARAKIGRHRKNGKNL